MGMTKCIARSAIVVGIIELILGGIAVICGSFTASKITKLAEYNTGLWALYYLIPGVLGIMAGVKKKKKLMAFALATNLIGMLLAITASVLRGVFVAILANYNKCFDTGDECICFRRKSRFKTFSTSCSNLDIIRNAAWMVVITYSIQGLVCFLGCIFGCIGICCCCCARRAPAAVVSNPLTQPNTIVVYTTNQPTNQGQPIAYVQGQPTAYGQAVHLGATQGQPTPHGQAVHLGATQGQPTTFGQAVHLGATQGQPSPHGQAIHLGASQGQPTTFGQAVHLGITQGQPKTFGQAVHLGTTQQQHQQYPNSKVNPAVESVE